MTIDLRPDPLARRMPLWIPPLAIICTGVLAYLPSINNSFISDDFTLLRFINELNSAPGVLWDNVSEFFRLISYAYFWTVYQIFGLQPEPYYLCSIALHLAASLLLYRLVRVVTGSLLTAWSSAMFFAAYARHEEAVMWISANNSTILTLNALAFLLIWERSLGSQRRGLAYYGAIAVFVVALFSKESSIVLIPLALLLAAGRWPLRECCRRVLPLVVLGGAFVTVWISQSPRNFFVADGHYSLGLHALPVYGRSVLSLLLSASPFLLVVLWLAVRRSGERLNVRRLLAGRHAFFFLAWLLATVAPVSFLTYSKYIPSRNSYFPSAALAALVGILFVAALENAGTPGRVRLVWTLFAGVLAWNLHYLWFTQDDEYVKRAAPTRELISVLENIAPEEEALHLRICGFPLHEVIGKAAIAQFARVSADNVSFVASCEDQTPFAVWDAAGQRFVPGPSESATEGRVWKTHVPRAGQK